MGHHPHTATILPFPGRARSPLTGGRTAAGLVKPGSERKAPPTAQPYFMDSWYHQAAIDEVPQVRKS